MPTFKSLQGIVFILIFLATFGSQKAFAATIPYAITTGIPAIPVTRGVTFFTTEFIVNYQTGRIILSANSDGTGNTQVDDMIEIIVTRPDGTIRSFNHFYPSQNCSSLNFLVPSFLTNLFLQGENKVVVKLKDSCGHFGSSSPLYLVNTGAPEPSPNPSPSPTPFLDLPWDYEGKGLSFNEAANSMSSYFDHEYPLLSSVLSDPSEVINFRGPPAKRLSYSSHDGYDYAKLAKVYLGDPVLAAAEGEATYMGSCGACGNAILIDHKNGYQTRYYHLQKDGLVVNQPGQKVIVNAKQQIGKVGATGNVFPTGDAGAHIHFMIVQDKDKDGNFENNLPDGVTDPFGWQSKDPDPWEIYTFFYAGKNRTGNKSYYLWKKKLDNLDATLTSNGGVFKTERYTLDFPAGSTDKNLNLNIQSSSIVQPSNSLSSIGSTIIATAKDTLGNLVSQFQALFTITANFAGFDLSRYKTDTISFYSSQDGINWTKEDTTVDLANKTASSQINHMTHFALMAERIDTIAPTTVPILAGEQGQANWFRSDVQVTLDAKDNEGGLGVDYTMYRLPSGDWEIYNNPLNFTDEGHYKIEFYSADNDENFEEFKSIQFDIDKTIPEAKIFIDQDRWDLVVEGIDQNQTSIQKLENNQTKRKDDAVYAVSDLAGNTVKLDVRERDKEKNDKLRIHSLQYNQATPTELPNNKLIVEYKGKKDKLNVEEQRFEIKKEVKIRIKYNPKKNQSTIIIRETGQEKVKESRDGLFLLQLKTNKGILEYSY